MPEKLERSKTSDEDGKNTETETESSKTDTDKSGSGDGSQDDKSEKPDSKTITLTEEEFEARFNKLAGKIRAEEKSKYERQKAEEDAEAERKKREAEGKFEDLYNTEKSNSASLKEEVTKLRETNEELSRLFHKNIDREIADWPDSVKALIPGSDKSVSERLEQVEKCRKIALEMSSSKKVIDEIEEEGDKSKVDSSNVAKRYGQNRYQLPKSLRKG